MYTHVYLSPSNCETPEVFACKVSKCDGCYNNDPRFKSLAAAERYAERNAPTYD
jgi:hypothetical protein